MSKTKPSRSKKKAAGAGSKTTMLIVGSTSATRTLRFGGVTVTVGPLAGEVAARNIKHGQRALKRASKTLATPGVTIVRRKTVPYFHADPKVPGRVIRVLNGKRTSGTFDKAGAFKTTAT